MKLLIDGDVIAYVCAYVADRHTNIDDVRMVVRNKIQHLCDMWGTYDYEIILTDPNREANFRHALATIKPYKGTRGKDKPRWLKEVRGYLVDVFKADMVSGWEADDELAARQTDDGTMIVTIDKDLFMVPGRIYDTKADRVYVSFDPGELYLFKSLKGVGFKWFCAQCLMGDTVDNIPGLRGYGDKTAYKLLKDKHTVEDLWQTVVNEYDSVKRLKDLKEIASLLWVRTSDDINHWSSVKVIEPIFVTKKR